MIKNIPMKEAIVFDDEHRIWSEDDLQTLGQVMNAFTNNGVCEREGEIGRIQVSDLISTPDATRFIPAVVQTVVREALEPNLLIVPSLFQEVQLAAGRSIEIGAVGAMIAADIAEGTEYPERTIDLDGGDMTSVHVSKSGILVRVTDEMISDSQFDVIGLWLRHAARALARHKEQKAMKLLDSMGVEVFNNSTPGTSQNGTTTGRGIDGRQNGSMTMIDLFDMYAYLLTRGFVPNVIIMHPLAWKTFMTDPEMREIVLQGNTLVSNRLPNGQSAPAWGTSHGSLGLRTTATGRGIDATHGTGVDTILGKIGANPWVQTLNPMGATFQIAPRFLPSPLTVLVTPFVRFNASATVNVPFTGANASIARTKATTSIIMADSQNTGLLVMRDPVSTEEYDDPARDIRALKIRERYGFGLLEQGKSVAVANNIVIDRNYTFENTNPQSLTVLHTASGIVA